MTESEDHAPSSAPAETHAVDGDDPAAAAARLFDATLDAPLTESRLRAIAGTGVLAPAQLARAAQLVGGPLPGALWMTFLQRVLLLLAAGHVVAGVVVLFVEIWEDLGRAGSVALTTAVALAPALAARRVGLATTLGGALLTSAALLCGAVVGVAQLAYPLPVSDWIVPALLVVLSLPFALASRAAHTWLVPLGALHVAAAMLLDEAAGTGDVEAWLLTAGLGAGAWLGWTTLARGVPWMRTRLVPRTEAALALTGAAVVAVQFVAAGWMDRVDVAPGVLSVTTLVVAATWLTRQAFTRSGDVLLAALAIVACAIVAAVGVARGLEQLIDAEFAFAIAGLGLVGATAAAVWVLRNAGTKREPA